MLVSCAGVCEPREVVCTRPPAADYEHQLCAQLAAQGECFSRPTSFLAQCFRACSMADPEAMLHALLAERNASTPFPTDAPVAAAVAEQRPGESLPVEMGEGDVVKMGSTVVTGEVEALVAATGINTFFGKTAALIGSTHDTGNFQKVIIKIT